MKIKSIKIKAFRGIPDLERDIDGKGLIIHGENGSGKSSIVDAIDFFFTGKISHLSRPFSIREQGTHVKCSHEDVKVSLELNPGTYALERTLKSAPLCPDPLQNDFKIAESGKFILHRSQILEFVNNSPGNRYKSIGKMMDIDELEKIEKALKESEKHIQDDFDKESSSLHNLEEKIRVVLKEDTYTDDILPIINNLLIEEGFIPLKSIDEIEEYVKKLEKNVKSPDHTKIHALNDIQDKIKEVNLLNNKIIPLFEKAKELKDKILESHDLSKLSLIEILQKSKRIINKETKSCPICENNIDGEKTIEKIDERLHELEVLKEKEKELISLIKQIADFIRTNYHHLNELKQKMDFFEEFNYLEDNISNEKDSINILSQQMSLDSVIKGEIDLKSYNVLKESQEDLLIEIQKKKDELQKVLVPSEKDEKISEISKILLEINENINKLDISNQNLLIIEDRLKIAKKAHEIFLKVRKSKIQEIYGTVEEDVQNFYNVIHPNDLHEDIKLNIDKERRASTNLRMTIFGKEDSDPRSLSSEGHLDSLGLCIFLALFKNFNKNFPIMILDDVVSTMDSRHRENVCKLLFEEFGDKQLIITTHDGIWFEQLKAAQRAYNIMGKFENIHIVGWDLERGPIIKPYKARWEKIEDKIENGDKNCAGNEGRRYLEWLLENICTNSKASIMIKPSGRFEINDLFNPAKQRLNKLIKDSEFKEKIFKAFQNLEKTIIMGNLLSHENLMAGNVSIDEVERFCKSVHELHELMLCDNCKNPLKYYQELKIFRCSNERCSKPLEIKAK